MPFAKASEASGGERSELVDEGGCLHACFAGLLAYLLALLLACLLACILCLLSGFVRKLTKTGEKNGEKSILTKNAGELSKLKKKNVTYFSMI